MKRWRCVDEPFVWWPRWYPCIVLKRGNNNDYMNNFRWGFWLWQWRRG